MFNKNNFLQNFSKRKIFLLKNKYTFMIKLVWHVTTKLKKYKIKKFNGLNS